MASRSKGIRFHYIACAWIPRIVFPKREQATWAQSDCKMYSIAYAVHWRNMVKDAIAKHQIELSTGLIFIKQ